MSPFKIFSKIFIKYLHVHYGTHQQRSGECSGSYAVWSILGIHICQNLDVEDILFVESSLQFGVDVLRGSVDLMCMYTVQQLINEYPDAVPRRLAATSETKKYCSLSTPQKRIKRKII